MKAMSSSVCVCLTLAACVLAAPRSEAALRAVVIADSDYKDSYGLKPLPKSVIDDAAALENVLRSLNYDVTSIPNQSTHDTEMKLDAFAESIRRDDTVLFYYSGHGIERGTLAYLLPKGADPRSPDTTGIRLDRELRRIRERTDEPIAAFIDACREVPSEKPIVEEPGNIPTNSFVFLATAPGRTVSGDSLFTRSLAKYLDLKQLAIPGEPIQDIARKVTENVEGKSGGQTPRSYTSLTAPLFIIPPFWHIQTGIPSSANALPPQWWDAQLLSDHEAWLGGVVQWGGGGGPVGRGILLRTTDAGATWHDETKNIQSGVGQFSFFGVPYSWDDVGPIKAMSFTSIPYPGGKRMFEGTLAASSGIYRALFPPDAPANSVKWTRLTVSPNIDPRYSFFNGVDFVEHEIYAVGTSGIAHASQRGQHWDFQLLTARYYIAGVKAVGDPTFRQLWAVGQSPDGVTGAIYHLQWPQPGNRWETVSLKNVVLGSGQALADIYALDPTTAVAIGRGGVIVRGTNLDDQRRRWEPVDKWSPATSKDPDLTAKDFNLNAIARDADGALWIVGDRGLILRSDDLGLTWKRVPSQIDGREIDKNLFRIRFSGRSGFIAGDEVVLAHPRPLGEPR